MKKQRLFAADGMERSDDTQERLYNDTTNEAQAQTTADEAATSAAFMVGTLLGRDALSRRPGLKIGQYFISLENIQMWSILVVLLVIAYRVKNL